MNLRGGDMLVLLCACIAFLATCVESFTPFGVARAIPTPHMALTGTPMTVISGISLAYCFTKCMQWKCSAFNYGNQECELLSVFLCDNTETLIPRSNFTYYDVETDGFIEFVENYLTEPDCLTLNRCSPKCYPGPGDVGYNCISDPDCTTPFSDCRNLEVCECVAGYSYNPPTKTCVKPCPGSYGSSYTMTVGWYTSVHALLKITVDEEDCKTKCNSMPGCVSFTFDPVGRGCFRSTVSKDDPGTNYSPSHFEYFQRDCA